MSDDYGEPADVAGEAPAPRRIDFLLGKRTRNDLLNTLDSTLTAQIDADQREYELADVILAGSRFAAETVQAAPATLSKHL